MVNKAEFYGERINKKDAVTTTELLLKIHTDFVTLRNEFKALTNAHEELKNQFRSFKKKEMVHSWKW